MLVTWMKLLLFAFSWGNIHTTEGLGSTQTPAVSINLLTPDVKSVVFKEGLGSTQTPAVSINLLTPDVKSVVFKGGRHVEKVQVLKPTQLALECNWSLPQSRPDNITGFWRKDGSEVSNSSLTVPLENLTVPQYNLRRTFSIADEESLGIYSCVFDNQAEVDFVLAAPRVGKVRDKPIVSYVGDSVVLECKMEDPKSKPNTWNWYRANNTGKELIATSSSSSSSRYHVENKTVNSTKLTVRNLTEADTGSYYCGAVYDISVTLSRVDLRVITFMEPLKPFLFIMAEVFILVSVILLCERWTSGGGRQHKDNTLSDDQANKLTPEDGCGLETESTARQRKL